MEVLESWEKAEDEKIQELIEIRKKVRHYRQKEKEKAENTMINNKQFAYTICSNIYKYLQTDQEQEKKMHQEIIRNIFNCLKVKCNIYKILENILFNMFEYEQTTNKKLHQEDIDNIDDTYNNDIYAVLGIEEDFKKLKDKLITENEKEQLKEIKDIAEREEEKGHNNDYINKLQDKYYRIIASVFFNIDNTTIRLIDGEEIHFKNCDKLIVI